MLETFKKNWVIISLNSGHICLCNLQSDLIVLFFIDIKIFIISLCRAMCNIFEVFYIVTYNIPITITMYCVQRHSYVFAYHLGKAHENKKTVKVNYKVV